MSDRPSWEDVWMMVAETGGSRSRCSRAQVGAVIVSSNGRIAATGYNGPAATWPHEGTCINWCPRAQRGADDLSPTYDDCPAIHAEANALMYVDRSHVEGGTIYVTALCCMPCAKLISNSGLTHVFMKVREQDAHRSPERVIEYLTTCGIIVDITSSPHEE